MNKKAAQSKSVAPRNLSSFRLPGAKEEDMLLTVPLIHQNHLARGIDSTPGFRYRATLLVRV